MVAKVVQICAGCICTGSKSTSLYLFWFARRRYKDTMTLELREAEVWSIPVGRGGLSLRCRSGMMWVTQEGDPEDHIITFPGRFETRRPGKVAVVALEPTRFEVVGADVEVRVHPHVRHAGAGGAAAAQ